MNRKALISINKIPAAELFEIKDGYRMKYLDDYSGPPVSLALPRNKTNINFQHSPLFLMVYYLKE